MKPKMSPTIMQLELRRSSELQREDKMTGSTLKQAKVLLIYSWGSNRTLWWGFLYTNKESVSLGIVVGIKALMKQAEH